MATTIDLRSDTVTRPTPAMLEEMMEAEVGDDVLDDDPSVKKLEDRCAQMFGMDAGFFCPSGTMSNQLGIKLLTQPYEVVICYDQAHIHRNEGGGLAGNSLVNVELVSGDHGRFSVADIERRVCDGHDLHHAQTTVLALENTVAAAGGAVYSIDQIAPLSVFARSHNLAMHLDGARLFNALVVTGDSPKAYGAHFDTISICFSKGLGAPIGSILLCKKEQAHRALRFRKAFGGGMRQGGYLAAAALHALDHHVDRLVDDHARAKRIAKALQAQPWVASIFPVDTNIIFFTLVDNIATHDVLERLARHHILALHWDVGVIRMVTHLDIDDEMVERVERALHQLF